MLARVKQDYAAGPVIAFSGREYVRHEWREVPAGFEDEALNNPFLDVQSSLDEISAESSQAPGLGSPETPEPQAEPEPGDQEASVTTETPPPPVPVDPTATTVEQATTEAPAGEPEPAPPAEEVGPLLPSDQTKPKAPRGRRSAKE